MKSLFLKTIIIMACITFWTISIHAQNLTYTGVWALNLEKSKFGEVPAAAAVQKYKIESNQNDFLLTMTTKDEKNEDVITIQKVLFDGTSLATVLPSKRTRSITASISKDGQIVTLNKSYSKPELPSEIDYNLKEVLTLNNGGKELVIELTSPEYTITAVYDKVESK